MKKLIDDVVAMPCGCETSRFVACFASAFMRAEGITHANAEAYCPKQSGPCVACGVCGDVDSLRQRHGHVYNLFSVVSGYGFMLIDLSDDAHMSRDWDVTCDLLLSKFDDYIRFTMDFAGYHYSELTRSDGEESVFAEIRRSIDADRPVLMQFEERLTWVVVTGYDDDGSVYGYDGSYDYWGPSAIEGISYDGKLFRMEGWYPRMLRAIILGDAFKPTLTMTDVYRRDLRVMGYTAGLFERSESYVRDPSNFADLDVDGLVTMRDRISQFIGLPIDMRSVVSWHIPVPPTEVLLRYSDNLMDSPIDSREREHLLNAMNSCCCYIHDTLWIAWRAVGEFMGGSKEDWGRQLSNPAIRQVVADVIGIVAHYDRDIRDALTRLVGES